MQCEIKIEQSVEVLYETLLEQQLLYFQHFDPSIDTLEHGTRIHRDFYTKLRGHAVHGQSCVTKIEPLRTFEIESAYAKNRITQTFALEKLSDSCTLVRYSENSEFESAAQQTNYGIVSWFYTFFFKRQTKKRLKQLGAMACR